MSRRTDIADAAITTLATQGMRGLTHRAVDRAAQLPEGSTSYYFPTRQALLLAAVQRLAEINTDEISALPAGDAEGFTKAGAELVLQWMTVGRDRQLARYELTLEATRRPELREALVSGGDRVRAVVAGLLDSAGLTESTSRARDFVACLDGLLLDQIAEGGREPTVDHIATLIRALLGAITR